VVSLPSRTDFFKIEFLKVWPIFYATSEFFLYFLCLLQFFKFGKKKCRKLHFFKWQLPVLILDMNVKFNFNATFINIVYAYFKPF
jgi:hypothetical protein